jgi:stress response protein YsnF
VDQPLHSEEVEVERVAINRFVEAPPPVRQEGDTTIIPLLEEVLIVEKRLLLREEVHIKKLSKEVHEPQEVLLREERVEIVRKADSGQGEWQSETKQ